MQTETLREVLVESPIEPGIDFVVVKRFESGDVTPGGIIIPDKAKGREDRGIVIEANTKRIIGQNIVPMDYRRGDVVLVSKHGGMDFESDGQSFSLFRAGEVYGKEKCK